MNKNIYLLIFVVLLLTACSLPLDGDQGIDEVTSSQNGIDSNSNGSEPSSEVVTEQSESGPETVETAEGAVEIPQPFDFNTLPQGDQIGIEYAGLLYTSAQAEGAWIVDSDGFGRQLIDTGNDFVFNPESFQIAYLAPVYEEDIFLYDLISGETTQLTDTPDLLEGSLAFMTGSDLLAFNYMPQEQLGPWAGYLGAVDIKTGEYLILDDQSSSC